MKLSHKHRIYERLIRKKDFLKEASDLVKQKLSQEQLNKLSLIGKEGTYGIYEQMFLRYVDNRYSTFLTKEEVLKNVGDCIKTYRFILDSDLEPKKIRYPFIKALMDVISTGSGVYFLGGDSGYDKFGKNRSDAAWRIRASDFKPPRRSSGTCYSSKFQETFELIGKKYPRIPYIHQFKYCRETKKSYNKKITHSLWEQLLICYAYPLSLLEKKGELNVEEFRIDFFKRHKWCLERLSKCNYIFTNKHKEKICEDMSYYLGKDPDLAYYPIFIFPFGEKRDIPTDSHFLSQIKNVILDCFSPKQLHLFKERDADGNLWDFGEQILDRYYSKYPSFAPWEKIETKIKETIEEYKSLLNSTNSEVIKEIIMDEVERIAFVSKPTHLWNLEMNKNLEKVNPNQINKDVFKAVDALLKYLSNYSLDYLKIEVDGKEFSLRERLLARWKTAMFSSNIKKFIQYLSKLHIYTPNSPNNGNNSPSEIDLQALLGEIDMFFLYPSKGRRWKKLFSRLDTGRVAGGMNNIKRTYMSLTYADDPLLSFAILILIIAMAIFLSTVLSLKEN